MRRPGRDGIKKGGLRDPVARSIRNEQNRDAMPSKEEVEAEHKRFLSEKGCLVCGESDPENLKAHQMPYLPSCSAVQHPPHDRYEPDVFCHEHYRSPKTIWEANMFKRAWDREALGVAFYECGSVEFVEEPEPETHTVKQQVGRDDEGNPVYEEVEQPVQRRFPPRPEIHARCRCGSNLKEVRWLSEDDAGES